MKMKFIEFIFPLFFSMSVLASDFDPDADLRCFSKNRGVQLFIRESVGILAEPGATVELRCYLQNKSSLLISCSGRGKDDILKYYSVEVDSNLNATYRYEFGGTTGWCTGGCPQPTRRIVKMECEAI